MTGAGERYVVFGLGRSGIAACEAIRRMWPASAVVAVDARADVDAERLRAAGVEVRLGGEEAAMSGVTALVKTPGAPADAPPVRAARAAGVPVWAEVELAARMLANPIAGVTGTNGKTTTTALLGAMLREAGLGGDVAGNIGRPLSALAGRVDPDAWIACELSSFQLEDAHTLRPRVAVILNVTPDHLDRHGTFDAYAAAKLRILALQRPGDVAVVNGDDAYLRAHAAALPGPAERRWFTRAERGAIDWEGAQLRGDHNLENALAAAAAARAAGASAAAVDRALRAFAPPPHRLEPVAEWGGVRFVNDSKATNPDATRKALTAFDGGVRLILGGSLKGGGYDELAADVAAGPVASVYLIGQAADAIAAALDRAGVAFQRCGELAAAVARAAADAEPGDTVLLSPACASYDQFRDYEERGERFRALAASATGAGVAGG